MDLVFKIRRQLGRSSSFRAGSDSVSTSQTPHRYLQPKRRIARSFENERNVLSFVLDDEVNDRGLAMTSSF